MGRIAYAALACLAIGWSSPRALGETAVGSDGAAVAGAPGQWRRPCRLLDQCGHVHRRWCAGRVLGPFVNEPPAPIPSPHYYWRG